MIDGQFKRTYDNYDDTVLSGTYILLYSIYVPGIINPEDLSFAQIVSLLLSNLTGFWKFMFFYGQMSIFIFLAHLSHRSLSPKLNVSFSDQNVSVVVVVVVVVVNCAESIMHTLFLHFYLLIQNHWYFFLLQNSAHSILGRLCYPKLNGTI